jgi:serine/threonine protein kinase
MTSKDSSLLCVGEIKTHYDDEQKYNKYTGTTIGDYTILKKIGTGKFANVYTAKKEDNIVVACKMFNESTKNITKMYDKEVDILKSLSNTPNDFIVKYISNISYNNNMYIFMEYIDGMSLYAFHRKYKDNIPEELSKQISLQILEALDYIHNAEIVHQDLSMKNILLSLKDIDIKTKFVLKICDFGLSKLISDTDRYSCGTPNFISPEMLLHLETSPKSDIWSFGVIVYTLLYKRPPFETLHVTDTYRRIKNALYYFPSGSIVSEHAKLLIKNILKIDPKSRYTIPQIRELKWWTTTNETTRDDKETKVIANEPGVCVNEMGVTNIKLVENLIDMVYHKLNTRNGDDNLDDDTENLQILPPYCFITKYIISLNYGMYYKYNTGSNCIHFQDNSHIMDIDGNSHSIWYKEPSKKQPWVKLNNGFKTHSNAMGNYRGFDYFDGKESSIMNKKYMIFLKYATYDKTKETQIENPPDIYVKKYIRRHIGVNNVLLCRYNNNMIQAIIEKNNINIVTIFLQKSGNIVTYMLPNESPNTELITSTNFPAIVETQLVNIKGILRELIDNRKHNLV